MWHWLLQASGVQDSRSSTKDLQVQITSFVGTCATRPTRHAHSRKRPSPANFLPSGNLTAERHCTEGLQISVAVLEKYYILTDHICMCYGWYEERKSVASLCLQTAEWCQLTLSWCSLYLQHTVQQQQASPTCRSVATSHCFRF